jgi:hypothetical protein
VGLNASQVLSGRIAFPWQGYTNQSLRLAFVDRLLTQVRALPGVSRVAVSSALPFTSDRSENAVAVEGRESSGDKSLRAHERSGVSADYWRTL